MTAGKSDREAPDLGALHALPTPTLRALAGALRGGQLSTGISTLQVRNLVGPEGEAVARLLAELADSGQRPAHLAALTEAIADARDPARDPSLLFDLVLSGPDVPGVPTSDTGAVFHALLAEAEHEVLFVGYAVYGGKRLFAPLARRVEERPNLRVTFCLDIGRKKNDTTATADLVRRFVAEFRKRHWPWEPQPEIWYDPRSLAPGGAARSVLHAKCVVVDQRVALISSANFTEAAQERNIEAGVIVRYPPFVARLRAYFAHLRSSGALVRAAG